MNIFNNLKIKIMMEEVILALVLMVCVRVHIFIKHQKHSLLFATANKKILDIDVVFCISSIRQLWQYLPS